MINLNVSTEEFIVIQAGLLEVTRTKKLNKQDRAVASELWSRNLKEYRRQQEEQDEKH